LNFISIQALSDLYCRQRKDIYLYRVFQFKPCPIYTPTIKVNPIIAMKFQFKPCPIYTSKSYLKIGGFKISIQALSDLYPVRSVWCYHFYTISIQALSDLYQMSALESKLWSKISIQALSDLYNSPQVSIIQRMIFQFKPCPIYTTIIHYAVYLYLNFNSSLVRFIPWVDIAMAKKEGISIQALSDLYSYRNERITKFFNFNSSLVRFILASIICNPAVLRISIQALSDLYNMYEKQKVITSRFQFKPCPIYTKTLL